MSDLVMIWMKDAGKRIDHNDRVTTRNGEGRRKQGWVRRTIGRARN
jgi:hypothetical protein